MERQKVLYVSGSLGLGHVTRDLAIARELRKQIPGVEIDWIASHPASQMLSDSGETVLTEAAEYANESFYAENTNRGARLNLVKYLLKARKAWERNVDLFIQLVSSKTYDLVIGDETYEISLALRKYKDLKQFPFVMIFDFVGLDSMTLNPLEKLGVYMWNRKWSHDYRKRERPSFDLGLFVGERNDIPDKRFGFLLPKRRKFADVMYHYIGYILPFDIHELPSKQELRKKLGYNNNPLVIASIGGTSIGKELLELCGEAYSILREKKVNLQMVLVTGPRLDPEDLSVPEKVKVKKYIPNLYEHFAASDLSIIQAGGTSAVELSALNKPFIYFPIRDHSEQANVARILRERSTGMEMNLSATSALTLARRIKETIHSQVEYPEIPINGAKKAAELIKNILDQYKQNTIHIEEKTTMEKIV